jgi:L-asparaginase
VKPRILLLGTGGTIGTTAGHQGLHEVTRGVEDLIHIVPELGAHATLVGRDLWRLPSALMTPGHMRGLAAAVTSAPNEGFDGVVVTHGTDSLEETAYALALMVRPTVPVALTGGMRLPTTSGADGLGNLLGAVAFCSRRDAAALGPCVIIQDEVHLARFVTKVHTSRVAAFGSPGFGPVGAIAEFKVALNISSAPSEFLGLPETLDRQVELLWSSAGASGRLIAAAAEQADGIVIAAMGGGHLPEAMARAAGEAVKRGIPVILASRTGAGPVLAGSYAGTGSEAELYGMGLIPAGTLPPLKARLKLVVGLQLGRDPRSLFVPSES